MSVSEIKKNRIKKLKKMKESKICVYPGKTQRTHSIKSVIKGFTKLSKSKKEIVLTGRLYSIRKHGGSTFVHFGDGSGKIQAYFKKDELGQKLYEFFLDSFDVGDFIEISGVLFKTRTDEKTIKVRRFKILTKSLLPLPEKWHGLKNVEERYRKRYLDLIFNSEIKDKFKIRSKIIQDRKSVV